MKSLLTRLTENIGDEIAQNINNNILEKLTIDKNTKIKRVSINGLNLKDLLNKMWKENPELAQKVEDYIEDSPEVKKIIKNNSNRSSSSSSSSGGNSSSYSCGRSSGSSCGRSSGYSSSCGRSSGSSCGSSRSSRSGGC